MFIGRRPSPARLLDTNRVALGDVSAIPIWAEAGIWMKIRKPHDQESEKTSHNENEQNAEDVGARWIPPRPSHLSIQERILSRAISHVGIKLLVKSSGSSNVPLELLRKRLPPASSVRLRHAALPHGLVATGQAALRLRRIPSTAFWGGPGGRTSLPV